jgi:putative addiction module component (TIGR02574 family)
MNGLILVIVMVIYRILILLFKFVFIKDEVLVSIDALNLSIPERIQLVEDIWDTIANEAEAMELTEAEKKIIDERLDAYHKNPEAGSPWEEVFQRITKTYES